MSKTDKVIEDRWADGLCIICGRPPVNGYTHEQYYLYKYQTPILARVCNHHHRAGDTQCQPTH